eukprot:4260748-Alexandrium_andersonii.AAC.1
MAHLQMTARLAMYLQMVGALALASRAVHRGMAAHPGMAATLCGALSDNPAAGAGSWAWLQMLQHLL